MGRVGRVGVAGNIPISSSPVAGSMKIVGFPGSQMIHIIVARAVTLFLKAEVSVSNI